MTQDNKDNNANNKKFEDLLENSITERISLEPGQLIEAKIVSISRDCIFLYLGGKSEGILEAAEMMDKDGNLTVKEGDTIKAYFMYSKSGEMLFTTRISSDKIGKNVLENAFESEIPIEGIVEKEIKGGFEIKIGDSRAFCPYSQMGLERIENSDEYIGRNLTFKIIEYGENGRNILLSNRVILEEKHKAKIEILKESLQEKMKVKGTVKSLQNFGAFVDIGGVQALLPISEISRSRVDDIHEALSIGQEIETVIMSLDWKNERLSLSMKKLLPDPWDEVQAKYKIDSKHTGKIVRLTNFGAFVSLEPGLDGLIHISSLEGENRINHPREVVKEGQSIEVQIKSIDLEKKRMSLLPVWKAKEEEDYKEYMDTGAESDTYNPFGDLLKGK